MNHSPLLFCILILIVGNCLISCDTRNLEQPPHLAITNVNLITLEADTVLTKQTVLILGNKIKAYGDSQSIHLPRRTQIIDGTGKYLIPGLCDMHMHIDHPDILKVNLAYGVTTVMNYRGLPPHLSLKKQSEKNAIFSPHIYNTGDYMEGYPATFPGFLSFKDPEGAKLSVQEQEQQGYDFIKVYRNLDTVMLDAIGQAATENNMTIVGHLSPNISLEQSLRSGQKVVAHTEELMYFFNNENDLSKVDELIQLFKTYDVTYTPNLTIFRSLINQVERIDSINAHPNIQYLHPALLQSWRKKNNYNYFRGQKWANFLKARFQFLQEVSSQIKKAGIPTLTSTDAPTAGAFPGLAVHKELEELVNIGFTPREALRSASVEAGEFIKKQLNDSILFGQIKQEYRADLLLLNKNPLENIKNTINISGVIKNGQWYSNDEIQRELNQLSQHYKKVAPLVLEIEELVDKEQVAEAYLVYENAKQTYPQDLFLGYYVMGYRGYRFLYDNRQLTKDSLQAAKAVKFYEMYARDYPEMHGSYYFQGMAYKAKKDTLKAIEYFKKSLFLHPHNPYALRRMEELNSQ